MSRLRLVTLLVVAALAQSLGAQTLSQTAPVQEVRVALVIGNGTYSNVPLKNPVNDARDVAAALKGLGFSVTLLTDADLPAMSRAIREFGNAIKKPEAVALFYYSGHGVQYRGANYLIPARADIQEPDELSFAAVNSDLVYAKMESSGDKTNIVILDACRNNPFPGAERASERGLAVVGTVQPPQSLIVYATAPGKTAQDGEGKNGVFTAALLKHLAEPKLDAELMIRRVREEVINATGGVQVPWHNSSISGAGFAFAGGGRLLVATDPAGAEVFVDGQMQGLSPLTLSDLPRYSEIEVSARSGPRSAAKRLTLTDSSEARLQLYLETARGSIAVSANEPVRKALLDGTAATMGSSGLIEGVEVGRHSLELLGDSSGFRTEVEVKAGQAVRVTALLVPVGSLTLSLPEGAVCAIEGMGISESTTRHDYGQVPAGQYRLSVTGRDYESRVETVRVERGKVLAFAPELRYTTEYLGAKYGAQLDRLRKVADGKIVSQADLEEAEILARKIEAEGRPGLAALAVRVETLRATLASLRPAPAPAPAAAVPAAALPAAAAASGKATGTLTFTSDPPGAKIAIDGGEPVPMPVSLELPPGAHSFEPVQTQIEETCYLGQTKQWITVSAGSEISIPIKLAVAQSRLALRLAPRGCTVYVDGVKVGVTPLEPIEVPASRIAVRLEKPGEKPMDFTILAPAGETAFLVMGRQEESAVVLERRTIKLDGKPDSWEGIEPSFQTETGSFLGARGNGVQRIYVCRDDRYFYWRIDFFEENPFWKMPRSATFGIKMYFKGLPDPSKTFFIVLVRKRTEGEAKGHLNLWDNYARKTISNEDKVVYLKHGQSMLVARVEASKIMKYWNGPILIHTELVRFDSNYKETDGVKAQLGWIDFSK